MTVLHNSIEGTDWRWVRCLSWNRNHFHHKNSATAGFLTKHKQLLRQPLP